MPERANDRPDRHAAEPAAEPATGATAEPARDEPAGGGSFTREELQAAWLEFQRDGRATCPFDGAELEVELVREPSHDRPPEVRIRCPRGGRSGTFSPPDHEEVAGWAE